MKSTHKSSFVRATQISASGPREDPHRAVAALTVEVGWSGGKGTCCAADRHEFFRESARPTYLITTKCRLAI